MDLTLDQSNQLTGFVQKWSKDKKFELETTFGVGGVVTSNIFLQIAQRIRTKGFEVIPQNDRLSIITPNHLRLSIEGLGVIQSYCKDNSLENKVYTAMFKDRAFPDSNIDLHEYDMRFKMRREEDLSVNDPRVVAIAKGWENQKKAFRLIRRWSFQGKGIRIDMSIVRQTPTNPDRGDYQWATTFLQTNILQEPPRYEVEVELLHGTEFTDSAEKALKALICGVGEVQRAIQKNTLLIRNSISAQVRTGYQLITGTDKFRGVGPVTLQLKNISQEMDEVIPNIRTGYNVTDKADGLRAMGFVDKSGELFLIDQSMNVYRTGLKNEKCAGSLVDGEWVTMAKNGEAINHYLLFDIYYYENGEKVSNLPFITVIEDTTGSEQGTIDIEGKNRFSFMRKWYGLWRDDFKIIAKGITEKNRLIVALKHFEFASPMNTSIFTKCCTGILDTSRMYHTDGLIVTSNTHPIPDKAGVRFSQQFKWKPSKDNTVDFLINYERDDIIHTIDKITTTIHESNDTTVQYKTMRLYVGAAKGAEYENPRATILLQEPITKEKDTGVRYKPVLFTPFDFPDTMANTCHIMIQIDPETLDEYAMTEDSKEPIPNRSVVEMRYEPAREPGWRWVPSRIRHDKTERLIRAVAKAGPIKYSGIMNDEGVANDVWNSIHDPITISMIRTGNDQPTEDEMKALIGTRDVDSNKKYYERKAPKENLALIKGLQDFHNKYIKNEILVKRVLAGGNKKLVDVACGKAGDLYKWKFGGATHVLGVDYAADNITNISDGAYKRYLQTIQDFGINRVPKIAFAIGNSSKNIVSGEAGANSEECDILRSIFGRVQPEGPVPKYINNVMAGTFRDGADVAACMFALHYFFENNTTLNGFITNLSDMVKVGGYFIGCCFDGNKVFDLLRYVEKGHSKTGVEGDVPIWSITKEYDAHELTPDDSSIGLGINVEFLSIGSTHKEYLVPFELLVSKLSTIGFKLLNNVELRTLNLNHSTNMFENSYNMIQKKYNMTQSVKDFSFLNRWFIFKRQSQTEMPLIDLEEQKSEMSEAVATVSDTVAPASDTVASDTSSDLHFDKTITARYPRYKKFVVVPSSAYSVLKPWQEPQVTKILNTWFPTTSAIQAVVDATAHIGVDTIHLSDTFPTAMVDAYEIVPMTYDALVKNIRAFGKQNKITPHLEDITTWVPTKSIDLLYVDPPWGGEDYANLPSIDLYLQAEGVEPDENKNVNTLIDKWINSTHVKHVILKAPKNFNKTYLMDTYKVQIKPVLNRAGKLAYNLMWIVSTLFIRDEMPTIANTSMAATAATAATVEVAADDAKDDVKEEGLPDPTHTFENKDIFRFGPTAIDNDVLQVTDKSGKIDKNAGRYLSPSAYFPIPDRDNPLLTFPTVDHYLAAMKLKLISPEIAIQQMSTNGIIHQSALSKMKAVVPESTPYYKIVAEENAAVKSYKPPSSVKRVDESKWVLQKDDHVQYALQHRWTHDERFRAIVTSAKEQMKYLLYNIEGSTAASEFSGMRNMKTKTIKGENKMGRMIMSIAGFRFKSQHPSKK